MKREQYIIVKPEAKLWVGPCDNFIHAFTAGRALPDPEKWLIVKASAFRRIAGNESALWFHLQKPKPMRGNTAHTQYRGPLSAKDVTNREKNRLREAHRRLVKNVD